MAISPLENNAMISRVQDYATVKQNENNKGMTDQNNFQNQFVKEIKDHLKQVHDADNADNHEYRYDAKEKGNTSYSNNQKKKKNEKKKEEIRGGLKSTSSFDMKI